MCWLGWRTVHTNCDFFSSCREKCKCLQKICYQHNACLTQKKTKPLLYFLLVYLQNVSTMFFLLVCFYTDPKNKRIILEEIVDVTLITYICLCVYIHLYFTYICICIHTRIRKTPSGLWSVHTRLKSFSLLIFSFFFFVIFFILFFFCMCDLMCGKSFKNFCKYSVYLFDLNCKQNWLWQVKKGGGKKETLWL